MKAAILIYPNQAGACFLRPGHESTTTWLRNYIPARGMQSIVLDWIVAQFCSDVDTFRVEGVLTHMAIHKPGSALNLKKFRISAAVDYERNVGQCAQVIADTIYLRHSLLPKIVVVPYVERRGDEAAALVRDNSLCPSVGPATGALALALEAGWITREPRAWRDGGRPTAWDEALARLQGLRLYR